MVYILKLCVQRAFSGYLKTAKGRTQSSIQVLLALESLVCTRCTATPIVIRKRLNIF